MDDKKSYFKLYDDRYIRLRKSGVEDWVYDPQGLSNTFDFVDEFLRYGSSEPSKTKIIELGCGQGHLAEHLLKKGYKYLGIDISETAIQQALKKTGNLGKSSFLLADITDLSQITDRSFDLAIDNQCFHMLVVDKHREKYLSELKRILKPEGKVLFCENFQVDEFTKKIKNLEQFNRLFDEDEKGLTAYKAHFDGKIKIIDLPRLPARANNEAGYRKELTRAGFRIDYLKRAPALCIISASKKTNGK